MWGHRRYQSSSSSCPLRLSSTPHLPGLSSILLRRSSPTPWPRSSAGVAPTLFPVHLASSHHAVSLWPTRPISLRSIYYTSFSLPFPVRWFVFLVFLPSPHDQIKRRRSRKSRWWKDLGLVCHHRLTADEGEWELSMESVAGRGTHRIYWTCLKEESRLVVACHEASSLRESQLNRSTVPKDSESSGFYCPRDRPLSFPSRPTFPAIVRLDL